MSSEKFDSYHSEVLKALRDSKEPYSLKGLYEPIDYILNLGGKRIRPILTLMACDIYKDFHIAITPSLAIEVFHNFTLMHDDIMDKAPLRRGEITVHEKWNQNTAILSGDAMLIQAYQHLAKVTPEILPEVLERFNKTALEVCEGQQLDMDFENEKLISIDDYLNMIRLKTAVLLGYSLELGALIGGASENDVSNLYDFGVNIGLAFQIQDDILDVFADNDKFGKQIGGDIVANKKTFLLLKALELAKGNDAIELEKWLNTTNFNQNDKVVSVTSLYQKLGVRAFAEKLKVEYYTKALDKLMAVSAPEQKKQELFYLAESLMSRDI